eukprot:TRINITY_DN27463_c0_g1_i1.p1 TRINITY_DN27463_c0_g1~~TRINITY_DN27463_c0_g1_i1.p1  ORF type:complete len:413 (+),score=60.77 TRINITY_DN27463_c0_g1_i1:131-1240(+)
MAATQIAAQARKVPGSERQQETEEFNLIYSKAMKENLKHCFNGILKTERADLSQHSLVNDQRTVATLSLPPWIGFLPSLDPETTTSTIQTLAFKFQGQRIHTFKEHQSSIKSISVHRNDRFFVSGSRDGVVKLWHVDDPHSESKATYLGHKHSILDVSFVNSGTHVASCDTEIHVWDCHRVNLMYKIGNDFSENPLTCMSPIGEDGKALVFGLLNSRICFNDTRVGSQIVMEWLVPSSQGGHPRAICVDPHEKVLSIGTSTGYITLIDIRSGLLLHTWRAHNGFISQLKVTNYDDLLSSGSDQVINVWNLQKPTLIRTFKGHRDPINFDVYEQHLVSVSGKLVSLETLNIHNDCPVINLQFQNFQKVHF